MANEHPLISAAWKIILTIVFLSLVGWNVYKGATVQEIGIPGFVIKFGASNRYIPRTLTESQKEDSAYHLEAAAWAREHNRLQEALDHYAKALEIDKGNPQIVGDIEALQEEVRGGKK